jgi:hypothetical protein
VAGIFRERRLDIDRSGENLVADGAFLKCAHHLFMGEVEAAGQAWSRVEHHLREAGRAPERFGRELIVGDTKSPLEVAETIARWRDTGGTHSSVVTMGRGLDTAQAHIDFLAEVRGQVGTVAHA